jgi:phosphatidylglycerol:prolipoprotein diacylglycerol transferase
MLGFIQYPSWIHPEVIPGLSIPRWYGVMYLAAFVFTYLLFMHQLKRKGDTPNKDLVLDLFFWGIVGLLVGARIFYVLVYDTSGSLLKRPWEIILPITMQNGRLVFTGLSGMSYHGGLIGVIIAVMTFMKVKKIDILEWSDMLTAAIPLGYTFGRLGNFINGELFGRVTTVPWGMVFPAAPPDDVKLQFVKDIAAAIGMPIPGSGSVILPRHPSQLYEALFEGLILWLILWLLLRNRKPFKGFILSCYILGYGLFRFFIEYTREPDKWYDSLGKGHGIYPIMLAPVDNPTYQFSFFNFTIGQILCFLMVVGAVICLFALRAKAKREAPAIDAPMPTGRKLRKKLK